MPAARQQSRHPSRRTGRSRFSAVLAFLRTFPRRPPVRLFIFALAASLWLGLIVVRLWDLQIRQASRLTEKARRQQVSEIQIRAKRGKIYDRFGAELARSTPVESIGVFPSKVQNPEIAADLLAEVLNVNREALLQKIRKKRFQWVKRLAEPGEAERVRALRLVGLHFEKENKRYYPKGTVAAHLLGSVGVDHSGLAGLEQSFESSLRGEAGLRRVQLDALRRRYASQIVKKPVPGTDLVLTIDQRIQVVAEKELAAAIKKTRAKAGTVVVMDPNNGDLLVLASWPVFDPNAPVRSEKDLERRKNFAISHLFEPGSTFKVITIAASLEEGLTTPDEVLDCQMGAIYIGSRRIRDHRPFGLLPVREILAKSSNVGAIKLGLRLGPERLHRYIRRFGFGARTGLPLPGEIAGLVRDPGSWHPAAIGSVSLGQEVGVTAVQLARAVSVIANGGFLVQPRLVDAMAGANGERQPRPVPEKRRVLSSETAATMRAMMEGVVLRGTGRRAQTPGYRVGGKTGTAQKIDPETRSYSRTDYIAGFAGFAPVNNPSVVIIVQLDSPVGQYHGGQVAAPVFVPVVTEALRFRDVPPSLPLPPAEAPSPLVPDEFLADFTRDPVEDLSAGEPPPAGIPVDRLTIVVAPGMPARSPRTETADASATPGSMGATRAAEKVNLLVAASVVPDFDGRTVREVAAQSSALGFQLQVQGSGSARRQWPEAGTPVYRGQQVRVEFRRSPPVRAGTP